MMPGWWLFLSCTFLLSFTIVYFQYKYLLPSSQFFTFMPFPSFSKMSTTFQFAADRKNNNSNVREIQIQCTSTDHCSNHQSIVFRHQNDDNISTKVFGERLDALEWTQGVLHTPDHTPGSIKIDATNKCPGVQDLAYCIFAKEHYANIKNPECCCSQWV